MMKIDDAFDAESKKDHKKIPGSIVAIGIFQVASSLWLIFLMAVTGSWELVPLLLAVGYGILGAGLLAVMEWARFIGVVSHALLLPIILWRSVVDGQVGLLPALQTIIVLVIFYTLSRPQIRAKFRRESYPPVT
jgi:hypothetical protein